VGWYGDGDGDGMIGMGKEVCAIFLVTTSDLSLSLLSCLYFAVSLFCCLSRLLSLSSLSPLYSSWSRYHQPSSEQPFPPNAILPLFVLTCKRRKCGNEEVFLVLFRDNSGGIIDDEVADLPIERPISSAMISFFLLVDYGRFACNYLMVLASS
jgi:hypothetical protein